MPTPRTASEGDIGHPPMRGGQQALLYPQLRVLSQDQLQELHWATLEVLERTGVYVEQEEAREILRGAGARVEGERVYIPSFLVDGALRTAPHNVTLYRRTGEPLAYLGGNRVYFESFAEGPWILDPYTGERRRFTSRDFRLTIRPAEASPYVVSVGGGGHSSDFPVEQRLRVNFKRCATHTTKSILISATDGRGLADIVELASIVAGSEERLRARPFILPRAEPTAPLCHVRGVTEMLLLAARKGLPIIYYSMTAAGSTAPCTDAGALVVGNADVLSGLVLHQLARPGAPFVHGIMPGVLDMSATVWAYGSPDFFLLQAAATELGHHYGLPVFGTGGCSDAKEIDVQLASELALGCLLAVQSGANLIHNVGLLDSGMIISPAQMVLTDEVLGMVSHMVRGVEVSPRELQLDLIEKVGPRGEFLTSEHTLRHFKRFWYPQLFERRRYEAWQKAGGQSQIDRLNARTCKIIDTVEVEPLPPEVAKELDAREQTWR